MLHVSPAPLRVISSLLFIALAWPIPARATPNQCAKTFAPAPNTQSSTFEFPKEITREGSLYISYGRPFSSDLELTHAKLHLFIAKMYQLAGARISVPVETREFRIESNPDSTLWQMYYKPDKRDGAPLYTWQTDYPADAQRLRDVMTGVGAILGDSDLHNNNVVHSLNGALYVKSTQVGIDPTKYSGPVTSSVLRSQFHSNAWQQSVLDLKRMVEVFPLREAKALLRDLGLPSHFAEAIQRRHQAMSHLVLHEAETSFDSPEEILAKIRENQIKNDRALDPALLASVNDLIHKRFERDFLANTDFRSFAEYKAWIMERPAYRKIVQEFWSRLRVVIHSSPGARMAIATDRFKGIKETQVGPMKTNGQYMRTRDEVDAENLGLSVEAFQTSVPARYHPVSAFLASNKTKLDQSDTQYGNDHFVLDFEKIRRRISSGHLIVTLTLGDSIRSSIHWHGKAIPMDAFPYIAAPFIEQQRRENNNDDYSTIDYRQTGYDTDALPNFLDGLEKRMRIHLRTHESIMDRAYGPPADYIEVQLYGIVDVRLTTLLSVKIEEEPAKPVEDALRRLGIELLKY